MRATKCGGIAAIATHRSSPRERTVVDRPSGLRRDRCRRLERCRAHGRRRCRRGLDKNRTGGAIARRAGRTVAGVRPPGRRGRRSRRRWRGSRKRWSGGQGRRREKRRGRHARRRRSGRERWGRCRQRCGTRHGRHRRLERRWRTAEARAPKPAPRDACIARRLRQRIDPARGSETLRSRARDRRGSEARGIGRTAERCRLVASGGWEGAGRRRRRRGRGTEGRRRHGRHRRRWRAASKRRVGSHLRGDGLRGLLRRRGGDGGGRSGRRHGGRHRLAAVGDRSGLRRRERRRCDRLIRLPGGRIGHCIAVGGGRGRVGGG